MPSTPSIGLEFKEALIEFGERKHKDNVCGIKIDLRSQGIDLIVGIRFLEEGSEFSVCTAGTNCVGANDETFEKLSTALENIGVQSKSGAGIMIKRNATIVTTDQGCTSIQVAEKAPEAPQEVTPKKRGLFGMFGK